MMLAHAKRRAADYGRNFNLTLEDVIEVAVIECPILKTPLRWEYQHGTAPDERSPSLDRIDNSRGYVKGNIAIISHRANTIKKSLTIDQIKLLFEYVSQPQQGRIDQLRPVIKRPKYTRMSQEEMQLIRDLHSKGWSCRKIAAVVTHSKSSVAAFIRRERSC